MTKFLNLKPLSASHSASPARLASESVAGRQPFGFGHQQTRRIVTANEILFAYTPKFRASNKKTERYIAQPRVLLSVLQKII